jgi:sugar phosphate permease
MAAEDIKPKPTSVRYEIIFVSVLMSFVLYLHRNCLGQIIAYDSFKADFATNVDGVATLPSKESLGVALGAFYFTYALLQLPAGWASDRFGARKMLTLYIIAWSLCIGFTGMISTIAGLTIARLVAGVFQAGAYPTSGSVIRYWFPMSGRGKASGLVSMGGRVGGATTAILSAFLITQTGSWRIALFLFAIIGLVVAVLYFLIVRDKPEDHPRVNEAEATLSGVDTNEPRTSLAQIPHLVLACCQSPSLWLNGLVQFATCVGWTFLVTWLPTFLKDEKGVDEGTAATMVSYVLLAGIPAQIIGGFFSDWSARTFGLRWGRIVPVATASSIAAIAYFLCPTLDNVWAVVFCCAVVSFMTDVGNPSFWAYAQDVGGKDTAAVYGWCNMLGNFGSSLSSLIIPILMIWGKDSGYGSLPLFMLCGGAYLFCTFAVLGMDATKPIKLKYSQVS